MEASFQVMGILKPLLTMNIFRSMNTWTSFYNVVRSILGWHELQKIFVVLDKLDIGFANAILSFEDFCLCLTRTLDHTCKNCWPVVAKVLPM